jgi:hypothetical protein
VKSDRKFRVANHNLQAKAWAQALPKRAFDFVTVNTAGYKLWSTVGRLSSGHAARLVVNRIIGQKCWRYLVSTDCSLAAQTVISYYLARWEVENFYRVAKQSLGWGDYQMRDLFAVERHVQLMMVAHAYLEVQRQEAGKRLPLTRRCVSRSATSNGSTRHFRAARKSLRSLTSHNVVSRSKLSINV